MVLPYINMNPPQVYTCSPIRTPLKSVYEFKIRRRWLWMLLLISLCLFLGFFSHIFKSFLDAFHISLLHKFLQEEMSDWFSHVMIANKQSDWFFLLKLFRCSPDFRIHLNPCHLTWRAFLIWILFIFLFFFYSHSNCSTSTLNFLSLQMTHPLVKISGFYLHKMFFNHWFP